MIKDLFEIRNMLASGKSLYDLPLKVTFYARVSTDRDEQINSLENQVMYFENYIKSQQIKSVSFSMIIDKRVV